MSNAKNGLTEMRFNENIGLISFYQNIRISIAIFSFRLPFSVAITPLSNRHLDWMPVMSIEYFYRRRTNSLLDMDEKGSGRSGVVWGERRGVEETLVRVGVG